MTLSLLTTLVTNQCAFHNKNETQRSTTLISIVFALEVIATLGFVMFVITEYALGTDILARYSLFTKVVVYGVAVFNGALLSTICFLEIDDDV